MNREDFLKSKLDLSKNNFSFNLDIQENQVKIFQNLVKSFTPASKITEDIKELVTGELNLCRDRNVVICFKGDNSKLNTLKYYLLMNFLSNWKSTQEYISNIVINSIDNYNSLSFSTISLEDITEMRFRDESKYKMSELYNVDILYLLVQPSTRLFEDNFYKDMFRVTLSTRANKSLVTIVIFLGTETQFKNTKFEERTIGIHTKIYSVSSSQTSKSIKASHKDNIDESEVFEDVR